VRVPRDKFTSQGRGFALVCFTAAAGLGAAMALGPAAQIRGRQLRVARASAQKAAVAASSKRARVEAAAAVAEANQVHQQRRSQPPGAAVAVMAPVAAVEPQLARWQRRAALHGDAGDTVAEPKAAAPMRRGPAPWEGVHAATVGPRGEDGAAGGGAAKVKKPRWRDLGRTAGGTPLVAPTSIIPTLSGKGSGRAAAKRKADKLKFRAAGVGKDGGHKRISSRKRPAVAARKALLATRKKTG
jgi:hypothetical protein